MIPLFTFKILAKYAEDVAHGISMRAGGVSEDYLDSLNLGLSVGDSEENVRENYRRFCETMGVAPADLCIAYQQHTDKVVAVEKGGGLDAVVEGVDGFMTNQVGVPLLVRFADCQGVLMYDPVRRAICAVHCGWRGNAQNIIGKAVKQMATTYGSVPADLVVAIGPSLGPCCGEFTDPVAELPEFMHKHVVDRHVDLWAVSMDQLREAGVLESNVEMARRCTKCENDKFFSYRGGKRKTGHMGGMIYLR